MLSLSCLGEVRILAPRPRRHGDPGRFRVVRKSSPDSERK